MSDSEITALRAKNERLREALHEIVDHPGGYPAEDVVTEMQEIARTALTEGETG